LWVYREWIALLLIIMFIYTAIRALQVFGVFIASLIVVLRAWARKADVNSHVVAEGETVVYFYEEEAYYHLSAEHEQAKAFASTRLSIKEEVGGAPSEDATVLELLKTGMNIHNIAMDTRVPPPKIVEIAKQAGLLPERTVK
jgi:hypothetical protein